MNHNVLRKRAEITPAPIPSLTIVIGTIMGNIIAPIIGVNATNQRIFLLLIIIDQLEPFGLGFVLGDTVVFRCITFEFKSDISCLLLI